MGGGSRERKGRRAKRWKLGLPPLLLSFTKQTKANAYESGKKDGLKGRRRRKEERKEAFLVNLLWPQKKGS